MATFHDHLCVWTNRVWQDICHNDRYLGYNDDSGKQEPAVTAAPEFVLDSLTGYLTLTGLTSVALAMSLLQHFATWVSRRPTPETSLNTPSRRVIPALGPI